MSTQHMTKEGEPDMRFKENKEAAGGSTEAQQRGGQIGGQATKGGQGGGQQSEHMTKEGEPDMRFKENKESQGDS